ncbi:MAG: VTT domain-containing protein [Dehalococcoidia bacterium]|nr:VTT domain-containing protein [Dehalococcoidia bacterium]
MKDSQFNAAYQNLKRTFWTKERLFQALAILLAVGLSVAIILLKDQIQHLGDYGYIGVFLISIAVSATIILPAPGWLIIATMGTILNPYLVGVISAAGATIGELTGYMLGYGGRLAIKDVPLYQRMVKWMERWGSWAIFVLALIPNPLFDVAGAVSGALRLPVWKFMLYGFLGRLPKHVAYALLGGVGLSILGCLRPG